MKILHVGNGNQKFFGTKYYDVGTKFNNGFIRNGHQVYFFSDRDIARTYSSIGVKAIGRHICNKVFIKTINNFRPDLIVLGHADIITEKSLEKARQLYKNIKIIQWNVDPIFRAHNKKQILSKANLTDATFITTAGEALAQFSTEHSSTYYIPNPVDKSIETERCHARTNQQYDVFWAMRKSKYQHCSDDRISIPKYLEEKNVNISYYGLDNKPEIFGQNYYNAIKNAKMGLNISVNRTSYNHPLASEQELYLYSSDRISHYMGCGLLTFINNENKLDDIFIPDKEIIIFNNKNDLREKIEYFSNHDKKRQEIAHQGWTKSHVELNSELITRYMIEKTFNDRPSHDYIWPTTKY